MVSKQKQSKKSKRTKTNKQQNNERFLELNIALSSGELCPIADSLKAGFKSTTH